MVRRCSAWSIRFSASLLRFLSNRPLSAQISQTNRQSTYFFFSNRKCFPDLSYSFRLGELLRALMAIRSLCSMSTTSGSNLRRNQR